MTISFPAEYDKDTYLAAHNDLRNAGLDDEGLEGHYNRHGRSEGRKVNLINSRKDFISLIPGNCEILEIMPGYSPVMTGPGISYFDTEDRSQLMAGAAPLNVATAPIPEIDFVSPDGDMSGIKRKFDIIVSSHNIGRHPDLVRHLHQLGNLLKPGGSVFCIIPDKRYCHNHYNNDASITNILASHHEQRSRHSLQDILAHTVTTTHADAPRHWRGKHGDPYKQITKRSAMTLKEYGKDNSNIRLRDVDAHLFTPGSFATIVELLNKVGLTKLQVLRNYHTLVNRQEFYVVMQIPG